VPEVGLAFFGFELLDELTDRIFQIFDRSGNCFPQHCFKLRESEFDRIEA